MIRFENSNNSAFSDGVTHTCSDIDECALDEPPCNNIYDDTTNVICTNVVATEFPDYYTCQCSTGYEQLDGDSAKFKCQTLTLNFLSEHPGDEIVFCDDHILTIAVHFKPSLNGKQREIS